MSENFETKQAQIKAEISQDNPRDIAEAIDNLACLRVRQKTMSVGPRESLAIDDTCEILKRRITDYLIVIDPRKGVFKHGE